MKAALVFVLLFATVLCRPARKYSASSSESSEEMVRPSRFLRKQTPLLPQTRAAPVQSVVAAAASASDESAESSEAKQAVAEAPVDVTADIPDATTTPDTASVDSQDSDDNDDDDDDTEETEEEEEEESSNSSESGESSTPSPGTIAPVVVTDEPVTEATEEPITATIVTDTGRGDNLGGYPSDYKSIIYVEDKSYHKMPSPYKSYEFVGEGKKTAYDMTDGNEVEKTLKVYKVQALQVHNELLEEDTSTPEVESQGLETSSGTSQDQELNPRQASLPEEEESAIATTSESESASTPEEEGEEESASSASDSASASQEEQDAESESSEEATATPGAADSDSDEAESDESEEQGAGPDTTTDMPAVITAK